MCSVTAFGRSVCSVVKTPPLHCPATGRLTRSARRYGDTESGFEVGLRTASPTIRPLRGGTTVGPGAQCTRAALGAWRPNACVLGGSRSRATDSIASAIKHCDLFPVNNKPKCRSWILVFSRKERKDRKAYRDGGLLLDFQAHPLF